jgi:undecaprenyl pyrophosphate phosphatase UppP
MASGESRFGGSGTVLTRAARIAVWLAGIVLALLVLDLLGVPVADWIQQLFKEIRAVPTEAIVGGLCWPRSRLGSRRSHG